MNDTSPALLFAYIDSDLHPAFVLHLEDSTSTKSALGAVLVHSNPALQSQTIIQKQLSRCLSLTENQGRQHAEVTAFLALLEDIQNRDYLTPTRRTLAFCGIPWITTVVNRVWVVSVAVEHSPRVKIAKQIRATGLTLPLHVNNGPRPQLTPGPSSDNDSNLLLQRGTARRPLGHVFPKGRLGDDAYLDWLQQYDWASSPLGPIEEWSPQLRQACEMMLASPDPVALLWSQDNILIYNAPYALLKKARHPEALAQPVKENWADVWELYSQAYARIKETGQAIKHENVLRTLRRKSHLEEDYFNFTFIPVLGEDASVAGVFCFIFETTQQVLAERRIRLLIDVDDSLSSSTSMTEVGQALMNVLSGCKNDVAFAALFTVQEDDDTPNDAPVFPLEAVMGVKSAQNCDMNKLSHSLDPGLDTAVRAAFKTGKTHILSTADGSLSKDLQHCIEQPDLREQCREVVVSPLRSSVDGRVAAVVLLGVSPVRDFDDEYQVFVKLLTEHIENAITAIKSMERERALAMAQATLESERRIMLFAETISVGIFMFDPDGGIKFCNKAYAELTGMTPEMIAVPMGWVEAVHPDSFAGTKEYWDRISCGEGPFSFEVQYKKPWVSEHDTTGSNALDRTWGLVHAFPEVSQAGELTGILGSITDISHHKWAARMQSERLSEALELKRQQDNFLDMTSHEMRNPLNAIFHCATELVEQLTSLVKRLGPTSADYSIHTECLDLASTIIFCANHQKRIVDDVLTLSKLDSRLLRIAPLSASPMQMVRQVLSIFESELRASGIEIDVEVLSGYVQLCIDSVFLDPHRVSQVIINLLSNAVKFTKEKPQRSLQLSVDASLTEPAQGSHGMRYVPSGIHRQDPTQQEDWGKDEVVYLIFLIRDTGAGMTPEEASVLFNRFSQASPRTHAQYGGTGLGLFISRELAEMHGGRIGLSSELGVGSTFGFYIKTKRSAPRSDTTLNRSLSQLLSTEGMHLSAPISERLMRRPSTENVFRRLSVTLQPEVKSVAKILIVEDNVINQRLLKKMMIKHGYDVTVANHGEEALAMIHASTWRVGGEVIEQQVPRIDLVLCDIEMPIMDGKTCVRRIRQLQKEGLLHPKIPVVAVTGNARREQVNEAKECGFDAVVAKPYKIGELIEVIEDILRTYNESLESSVVMMGG